LKKWIKKRQEIANYYNQSLKGVGDIKVPETLPDRTHTFHQYTIRTKYRNELKKYLEKNGIPTMIYYPLPLHLQPAFKYLGYKKGDFPEAEKASKEVLSLPIYPELSKENQDLIIEKIKEFYEK
jgi:dTDP-4-amino-4,6-dideoxygalactose transaminase